MATLKLLILSSFISFETIAQIDSTNLFEISKGTWDFPISNFKEIHKLDDNKWKFYPPSGTTFISTINSDVTAVFDGKVSTVQEVDGFYVLITQFGKYYITYCGLTKPLFTKGEFIKKGQVISMMQENFDREFSVEIFLSSRSESINSFSWFSNKRCL